MKVSGQKSGSMGYGGIALHYQVSSSLLRLGLGESKGTGMVYGCIINFYFKTVLPYLHYYTQIFHSHVVTPLQPHFGLDFNLGIYHRQERNGVVITYHDGNVDMLQKDLLSRFNHLADAYKNYRAYKELQRSSGLVKPST